MPGDVGRGDVGDGGAVSIVDDLVQQAIVLGRMAHQLELVILQRYSTPDSTPDSPVESPRERPRGKVQARILEHIDANGPTTVKDLAAALGNNEEVVRQAVGKLVKTDAVERNGRLVQRRHPV